MNLKTFLSVLLVYRSNFHVIHWMAEGKNFFTIHEKSAEYYDQLLDDADKVAEMLLRHEDSIVNYEDALEIIKADENHEFFLAPASEKYDTEKFRNVGRRMFNDILGCIEELLATDEIQDPKNVGIKSSLEAMHDKYDLEFSYLLNRLKD